MRCFQALCAKHDDPGPEGDNQSNEGFDVALFVHGILFEGEIGVTR